MAVTIYRSTDSSAPVLDGQVGSLVNLLDKCLVTGYGSQSGQGWTKPYTGTNKAVFRQPSGSNYFYLRVDDTIGATSRIVGYETMSDVDTGTGPFPTEAQFSGGLYVLKSNVASSATRPWKLITNGNFFYLFINSTNVTPPVGHGMQFGDFTSLLPGDIYNTLISASSAGSAAGGQMASLEINLTTTGTAKYVCRSYTQTGGSVAISQLSDTVKGSSTLMGGSSSMTYPDPVSNGLWLAPVFINEPVTGGGIRGTLPGLHNILHQRPFVDQDTITGSGAYAGKNFIACNINLSTTIGQCLIETSEW